MADDWALCRTARVPGLNQYTFLLHIMASLTMYKGLGHGYLFDPANMENLVGS